MTPDLAHRVIGVIAHSRRIPVDSISLDSSFAELNLQSLERLELLFALEDEFGIGIPDEEVNGISNVRGVVGGTVSALAEKAATVHRLL